MFWKKEMQSVSGYLFYILFTNLTLLWWMYLFVQKFMFVIWTHMYVQSLVMYLLSILMVMYALSLAIQYCMCDCMCAYVNFGLIVFVDMAWNKMMWYEWVWKRFEQVPINERNWNDKFGWILISNVWSCLFYFRVV